MTPADLLLAALLFLIATLYSSVGHAGASGYIAAMALMSMPAAVVKPTALALNILVAAIGITRFGLARLIPWRLVLPFVLASVPCAYLAARLQLPALWYQRLLALVLLLAAAQLWRTAGRASSDDAGASTQGPPWWVALLAGGAIGAISGLTGTGGAIFLTPLLLFANWAPTRMAAGASVVFVLCNSIAGLLGTAAALERLPPQLPLWLGAVALGALLGTQFGRGLLPVSGLRRVLALVLVIAAAKLALA